jgi:hypothetical protein
MSMLEARVLSRVTLMLISAKDIGESGPGGKWGISVVYTFGQVTRGTDCGMWAILSHAQKIKPREEYFLKASLDSNDDDDREDQTSWAQFLPPYYKLINFFMFYFSHL